MKLQLAPSFLSILALGILLSSPSQAPAQGNDDATIGIYLTDPQSQPCNRSGFACNDPNVAGAVSGENYLPYYAYVCVFNGDAAEGVAGASFGIDYGGGSSGLEIWEWTSCGDLEFAQTAWPDAGAGISVTWDPGGNCQKDTPSFEAGVSAIVGFFYVTAYGDDILEVINRPTTSGPVSAQVANCRAAETSLPADQLGKVAFSDDGSAEGLMPCKLRVIEEVSWGEAKKQAGEGN